MSKARLSHPLTKPSAHSGFIRSSMKTTFLKTLTALMVTVMLLFCTAAMADARYPARVGVLTDDANALNQTVAGDIAAYAAKVESATDVKLNVAIVQFLDGEPVQSYADTLFTRWALGENDLLVMGAAAEDTFAVSAGTAVRQKLSDSSLKSMLYSSGFADAFKTQQYDTAFGSLFTAFNDLLNKQYAQSVALDNLFKAYQPSAQTQTGTQNASTVNDVVQSVVDSTSQLWSNALNSITDNVTDYQNYHQQHVENGNGLTPGGWIVLVIIVLIVFGQSGPARRARRAGGCGCGPLGWIVSGLGLGALFSRHSEQNDRHYDQRYEQRYQRREERRGPGCCGRPPRW